MKQISLLMILVACSLACGMVEASEQDTAPAEGPGDERLAREQTIQRRLQERSSGDEKGRGGFVRLFNFSSHKQGFDVTLLGEDATDVPVGKNIRYNLAYPYRELSKGKYSVLITETGHLPATDDDFREDAPVRKPRPVESLKKLFEGLTFEVSADSCHTLLITGQGGALRAEILEDAPLFDEEAKPMPPELIFYNVADNEVTEVFWQIKDTRQAVQTIPEKIQVIKVGEPLIQKEWGISFLDKRERKRTRLVELDYEYGRSFSAFFMVDQYGKERLSAVENGLRAAVVDVMSD